MLVLQQLVQIWLLLVILELTLPSLLTDTFTVAGGVGVDTPASDTVTIHIGQPPGTTDSVTFDEVTVNNVSVGGDLSVTHDLTVSGTLY